MKVTDIVAGKVYRNVSGICRRVDSLAVDPSHPELKNRIVSWTLTHSKRASQPSGTCPAFEFAYWAVSVADSEERIPMTNDSNPPAVLDTTGQASEPPLEQAVTPSEDFEAIQQHLLVKSQVGANDLVAAFTVILTKETRNKDLEATIAAIQQIKGVASVNPVRADMQYFMAKESSRRELLIQLREVLKG